MLCLRHFTLAFLSLLVLIGTATAQDRPIAPAPSSVTITATASTGRVRITAPASIVQMHMEVYAPGGEKLFDQELRGGNVFDWHLQNGQAERLSAGDYVCVVTVKNVDVEAITIGDKHYWYSGGKWTEGSLDLASNGGADFAKKVAEMLKDIKYVGPETVNGIDCRLYSCTIDGSMGGQNWTGTAKIWIGAADGLPHQSDSDFKVANSFGGKSHIVYEYGGNIKVEPPVM